MKSPLQAMRDLLAEDERYKIEAYQFIRESLQFAHEKLSESADSLDPQSKSERPQSSEAKATEVRAAQKSVAGKTGMTSESTEDDEDFDADEHLASRHVTGQQLCQACRQYALQQYGYLAKMVLANWGVRQTGDFGNLVYNLIRIEQMRKSETDRREDFDDVYCFDGAFEPEFEFIAKDED